jgi:hypothetical protein
VFWVVLPFTVEIDEEYPELGPFNTLKWLKFVVEI